MLRRNSGMCRQVAAGLVAGLLAAPHPAAAAELRKKTLDAFELYVRLTEERVGKEVRGDGPFLWLDGMAEPRRSQLYRQLKSGQVVIEPMKTLNNGKEIEVSHGLIHHWMGVAFLPGISMMQAVMVTLDYNNHSKTYAPDIARSKLISKNGDDYQMYLRFIKHKLITVVEDTEHEVHFTRVDPMRAHVWSHTTRIQEVEDAGKSSEHLLPVGNDGGFMWRLNTYWRFVEKDGGTYMQCETTTLTRDIPWALRWLIGPYVRSIPKESLVFTVEKTKAAAMARQHASTTSR